MDFRNKASRRVLAALTISILFAGCNADGGLDGGNGGGGDGGDNPFGNAGQGFSPIGAGAATAVEDIGAGCVGCTVTMPEAVLSGSTDGDPAIISSSLAVLPVGGVSSVGIRVDLNGQQTPTNRNPGFAVSFPDVSALSVGALPDLSIETLLDGVVQDSQSYPFGIVGDSVAIAGLNLLDVNNAIVFLGVETSQPYDALRITLGGVAANALIDINVHQAYLDGVSGSVSGDFPI